MKMPYILLHLILHLQLECICSTLNVKLAFQQLSAL